MNDGHDSRVHDNMDTILQAQTIEIQRPH